MTLQIIGSGFGRTGTKSIKEAYTLLGFGPCHHMYEVLENPKQIPQWQDIAAGKLPDWDAVFAGYSSQIDWPGAHVWKETAAAFPNAKVVHSMRPEEKWWASFDRTIGKLMSVAESLDVPPHVRDILDMNQKMIREDTFGDQHRDKDAAIAAYRKRADEVKQTISADRLLVFDVADGWEPLCAFLDVDVPDEPFPHHNLRADFWEVLGGEPD